MKTRLFITGFLGIVLIFALAAVVAAQELPPKPASLENAAPASSFSTAWVKVISNGFGNVNNGYIAALEPFGGYLYAGTANNTSGGQIWRSTDGFAWSRLIADGFGKTNNFMNDLIEFNGHLYAGTGTLSTHGGEIWRSTNGVDWTQVVSGGFDDTNNHSV